MFQGQKFSRLLFVGTEGNEKAHWAFWGRNIPPIEQRWLFVGLRNLKENIIYNFQNNSVRYYLSYISIQNMTFDLLVFFFNSSPENMLIDFRERGRRKETLMWEKNIDWLPPVCALTRDRTHSPLLHGMMLQPTDPYSHRNKGYILWSNLLLYTFLLLNSVHVHLR